MALVRIKRNGNWVMVEKHIKAAPKPKEKAPAKRKTKAVKKT